jgi:hypothetical protein
VDGDHGAIDHAAAHHQRMTVGVGLRHVLYRNNPEAAGFVLDHDRLAQDLLHPFSDDSCGRVGRAAGRERDDNANGFGRKFLRGGAQRPQCHHCGDGRRDA